MTDFPPDNSEVKTDAVGMARVKVRSVRDPMRTVLQKIKTLMISRIPCGARLPSDLLIFNSCVRPSV
jgi:hypothetical protein